MEESVSDSETLGSRSGRPDRDRSEGELQEMGGAHAPVRSPQGIPGAGYQARLHSQTRQTGKAPLGRALCQRWLKAGILEDGEVYPNEEGTPQGGSISVMLSNIYLHYVLDLWFERVVKPRLR